MYYCQEKPVVELIRFNDVILTFPGNWDMWEGTVGLTAAEAFMLVRNIQS